MTALPITGIDHIEIATDDVAKIQDQYFRLGFTLTQKAPDGHRLLMEQGKMRFLITQGRDERDHAYRYQKAHGDGVCTLAFAVPDAAHTTQEAVGRGGKRLWPGLQVLEGDRGSLKVGAIQGLGDIQNLFVERQGAFTYWGLEPVASVRQGLELGLAAIDHMTNNVPKGEMDKWVAFYKTVFGMEEVRYFNIRGQKTGLYSKVVQLPNRTVVIPINEPTEDKSQIQEYLDEHRGPGVQHIAFITGDLIKAVSQLRERGFDFLTTPDTYYEMVPGRVPALREPLEDLQRLNILVDGDVHGYLLQIFTKNQIGPLFYEFIQRYHHWGFGEGNFQALFDAIERDQAARGVL